MFSKCLGPVALLQNKYKFAWELAPECTNADTCYLTILLVDGKMNKRSRRNSFTVKKSSVKMKSPSGRPVWTHLCRCYRFKCVVVAAASCASVRACIGASTKRCVIWPLHLLNSAPQRPDAQTRLHLNSIFPSCNVRIYMLARKRAASTLCSAASQRAPVMLRLRPCTSELQDEHTWFIYTQKSSF